MIIILFRALRLRRRALRLKHIRFAHTRLQSLTQLRIRKKDFMDEFTTLHSLRTSLRVRNSVAQITLALRARYTQINARYNVNNSVNKK